MPKKPSTNGDTIDLTIGPPPTPEVEPASPIDDELGSDFVNAPQVDETVVRSMLRAFSGVTSYGIGRDDVEDHWRFTNQELDDLTPPLTRVINRRPALRAAVARGDEAAIGIVLAGYTGRNVAAGRKAAVAKEKLRREQQQEEARNAPGSVPTSSPGPDPQFDANGYGRHGSVVPGANG